MSLRTVLAALLLASHALAQADHPPPDIRGMALPLHSSDPDFDYEPSLAELPDLGVDHTLLFVHLYQRNGSSPFPARHPQRTTPDETLLTTLRQARAHNLRTALLISVLLEHPEPNEWRGNLSPPDWDLWFERYTAEVARYARLAEDAGASVLVVGSELSSTESHTDHWRQVIHTTRAHFSGELTYSANWDHYHYVQFWDDLDFIGLSGYYELARHERAPQWVLDRSWSRVRNRLLDWRARNHLTAPLLFLEIGYTSLDGTAAHPWDYTDQDAPIDLDEQTMCYRAFTRAWDGIPELAGVFFYEWWGEGGPQDRGYTPRGKPALDVLRDFYRDPE